MPALPTPALLGFVLLDLTIILVMARSAGTLIARIGQPRVVGEIIAGVLLGPTLLGPAFTSRLFPAPAQAVIGQLGQLGLLLFSFLTAVELDRSLLRGRTRGVALVGAGSVLLPIVMAIPLAPVLGTTVFKPVSVSMPGFTLFVGVMLAATALPVMVRILQERGLSRSPLGCTGITASAVATVGLFIAASMASAVASAGGGGAVFRALGLAGGYLGLMAVAVRPLLTRFAGQPSGDAGRFVSTLVLVLASGLLAHLAGLTVIVGGFVAGLVLPAGTALALHGALEQRLGELTRSVLLPVFLAFSGLQTDLTAVPVSAYGGLVLLLAAGLVSKWGGGAVLARAAGLSWAESNVLGILMNCPGVLVLVVALIGVQNGTITPALRAGVVLVALIATAMTGPLLSIYLPRLPATSLSSPPLPSVRRLLP